MFHVVGDNLKFFHIFEVVEGENYTLDRFAIAPEGGR
jgi:hypothetical protein